MDLKVKRYLQPANCMVDVQCITGVIVVQLACLTLQYALGQKRKTRAKARVDVATRRNGVPRFVKWTD